MKGHAYRPDTLYEVVLRDGARRVSSKPEGRYLIAGHDARSGARVTRLMP